MIKIQLGSGYKKLEGFINIDLLPETKPDVVLDLDNERLPFDDNSVDYITSEFLFEHLKNFEEVLKDCHRVLRKGSLMYMKLPYATSLGGDYEYHYTRPRYWVFSDFDADVTERMVTRNPIFKIKRRIIFPRWCRFMELMNLNVALVNAYERTGLRYIIPALELDLKMTKV